MSLFDRIFRPGEAEKSDEALQRARSLFQTLTAYQPMFTNWGGAVYESEIVRAAIDARARHISKSVTPVKAGARTEPVADMVTVPVPSQYDTGRKQYGVHSSGVR